MTAIFHLVRHAAHDRVDDTLCGRMAGVRLGPSGKAQAWRLAEQFIDDPIDRLLTSPLERARETADEIGRVTRLSAEICDDLVETDFGSWSGMTFEALRADAHWSAWNSARSINRAPGGETMIEAQGRIIGAMERLLGNGGAFVLVSHADMIKAALLYHLGMSLDGYSRIEIAPASISTIAAGEWGSRVLRMNMVAAS